MAVMEVKGISRHISRPRYFEHTLRDSFTLFFVTAPSIPSVSVSRGLYQKPEGVTMTTRAAMLVQGRERWRAG